jgi:hypothetical protein
VNSELWVSAVTTLAGAIIGGVISFALSHQQIVEAQVQRAEDALRDRNLRSVQRRFDAYADFLRRARSYRSAIRTPASTQTAANYADDLAQAADTAGSLIFLAAESSNTLDACREAMLAIGMSQTIIHDRNHDSREARRPEASEKMALSIRQSQAAAREELGVGGVDKSWILSPNGNVKWINTQLQYRDQRADPALPRLATTRPRQYHRVEAASQGSLGAKAESRSPWL